MSRTRKTGITGQAAVVFGGGIGAGTCKIEDGSVTLALRELKEPLNPGEPIPEGAGGYEFQVFMNFDSMESLTSVREWLDRVEDLLKGRDKDETTPEPPTFEESQGEKKM
jgi:hypothetical protein